MSRLIDLTRPYADDAPGLKIQLTEIPLASEKTRYTGMVYSWNASSMLGSYIDFPGHIKETDDGMRADNADPAKFWRMPCSVIRLDRKSGSGGVTAQDLEKAFGGRTDTPAVIINALGKTEPRMIDVRSVWLEHDALDWLIGNSVRCLVSDIYESKGLHGVFQKLFGAGVSTVCEPYHLASLTQKQVLLTVTFEPVPGITQLPCRILAEQD